ncbi:unnamed protein product, partial [Thlaspi arvense]
ESMEREEEVKISDQIGDFGEGDGIKVSCFTEITLQIQIIRLAKQIYVWIGCNSAKFGNSYAAASTRPFSSVENLGFPMSNLSNTVIVASVLGGTSDNTGYGMAHRLGYQHP